MPVERTRRPTIALVAVRGALTGVDGRLRRAGVDVLRVRSVEPQPVSPRAWLGPVLRRARPDTVVVTSRAGVLAGVVPWSRAVPGARLGTEFWAVGPGTAAALRSAGVRCVRQPTGPGSMGVASAVGTRSRRRILYLRSDRAGPELARRLRRRGHVVIERVVYRLRPSPGWTAREKEGFARADLLVVTSPSGLAQTRRQLGRAVMGRLARTTRLVVLGPRSRRAAALLGFRRISVVAPTTAQRFTRHLLQELRHAPR